MDIWQIRVFADGKVHEEDRVGRDAAMEWAQQKLRDLGYDLIGKAWECNDDSCTLVVSSVVIGSIKRRI